MINFGNKIKKDSGKLTMKDLSKLNSIRHAKYVRMVLEEDNSVKQQIAFAQQ